MINPSATDPLTLAERARQDAWERDEHLPRVTGQKMSDEYRLKRKIDAVVTCLQLGDQRRQAAPEARTEAARDMLTRDAWGFYDQANEMAREVQEGLI